MLRHTRTLQKRRRDGGDIPSRGEAQAQAGSFLPGRSAPVRGGKDARSRPGGCALPQERSGERPPEPRRGLGLFKHLPLPGQPGVFLLVC